MAVKSNFASGEVLTASDVNTYLTNGGLVYITSAAWSSGGSVSINNCFSSTYRSYRIVVTNAKHATTSSNLNLRMRVGGVDKGTDSYYYGRNYISMGGASGGYTGGSNAAEIQPGIVATTTNGGSGVIDIHNPFATEPTTCTYQAIWPLTTGETSQGSGFLNNSTSYDGFSLIASSGNLTGLNILVFGYRQP